MADEPFRGFYPPRYTQVPNDLFDLTPVLKHGELRIVLYLIRETFGWHRPSVAVSLQRLQDEVGISHNTLLGALKRLEQGGYIIAARSISPARGNEPTTYSLRLRDDADSGTPLGVKSEPRVGAETDPRVGAGSAPPSIRGKERGQRQPEADALWKETLPWLQAAMNGRNYSLTFDSSAALGFDGKVLLIQVKDQHALREIHARYGPLLVKVLGEQAVRFEG